MSQEDNEKRFKLSVSTDKDGFLRRSCPSCGRDYKTEINDADLAHILAPQFQHHGIEIGQTEDDSENLLDREDKKLFCPYCQDAADISDTLAEELSDYLKRLIYREYILPQFNKAFSQISSGSKRSKGLFSIEISTSRSLLPQRPIHGPEQPDMKIIRMLCCDRSVKVSEEWNGTSICTYCGQSVSVS